MLKRDSLTAQMQQLSYTLAKVKRLILEQETLEASNTIADILDRYFGTGIRKIQESDPVAFRQSVQAQQFTAEEVMLLADFLDTQADLQPETASKNQLLERVLVLYDMLTVDYHSISFEHIMRRSAINAELSQS